MGLFMYFYFSLFYWLNIGINYWEISPLSCPKKDRKKKKLLLVDAFGIHQCSNQHVNSKNEVYDHPLSFLFILVLGVETSIWYFASSLMNVKMICCK